MSSGNPNDELLRFIRPGKREDGVFVPTPWAELKTQADPDLTKYQRKCYLVILSSVSCEALDEPTVESRAQVVKVRALIRVLAVVEEQPLRRCC